MCFTCCGSPRIREAPSPPRRLSVLENGREVKILFIQNDPKERRFTIENQTRNENSSEFLKRVVQHAIKAVHPLHPQLNISLDCYTEEEEACERWKQKVLEKKDYHIVISAADLSPENKTLMRQHEEQTQTTHLHCVYGDEESHKTREGDLHGQYNLSWESPYIPLVFQIDHYCRTLLTPPQTPPPGQDT